MHEPSFAEPRSSPPTIVESEAALVEHCAPTRIIS
jgi:hypothetical protein